MYVRESPGSYTAVEASQFAFDNGPSHAESGFPRGKFMAKSVCFGYLAKEHGEIIEENVVFIGEDFYIVEHSEKSGKESDVVGQSSSFKLWRPVIEDEMTPQYQKYAKMEKIITFVQEKTANNDMKVQKWFTSNEFVGVWLSSTINYGRNKEFDEKNVLIILKNQLDNVQMIEKVISLNQSILDLCCSESSEIAILSCKSIFRDFNGK